MWTCQIPKRNFLLLWVTMALHTYCSFVSDCIHLIVIVYMYVIVIGYSLTSYICLKCIARLVPEMLHMSRAAVPIYLQ